MRRPRGDRTGVGRSSCRTMPPGGIDSAAIRCPPCGRPSRPCRSAFVSPRIQRLRCRPPGIPCRRSRTSCRDRPNPWAPTVKDDGINFAIHSAGATRLELLLFDNIADQRPTQIIPLPPETHRTGDIWHIFVEGLPNRTLYNIRADGPYNPSVDGTRFNVTKTLLDPYATAVTGDFYWQSGDALGYDNSDPTDPDRHLLPSDGRQRGGGAALRRLPERLRLGGGPASRHPDRGVDHLRGQRPRLHPAPLVRERPRAGRTAASSRRSPT